MVKQWEVTNMRSFKNKKSPQVQGFGKARKPIR